MLKRINFYLIIFLAPFLLFSKKGEFFYKIYYYNLPVGFAHLNIIENQNNKIITLKAKSTGLANLIVPFLIECKSIFKNNKTVEYHQISNFKKEFEYFLVKSNKTTYAFYFLLNQNSKILKKYFYLIDKSVNIPPFKALLIKKISTKKNVYDPLTWFVSKIIYNTNPQNNISKMIINNTLKDVKTTVKNKYKYLLFYPNLDDTGVFKKSSIAYIKTKKKNNINLPFYIFIDAKGFGKFKIKLKN